MNLNFPFQTPTILTTRQLGDGLFIVPGNVILGFDHTHKNIIGFSIQPYHGDSYAYLFFCSFNPSEMKISDPLYNYPLFSENGKISANPNNFEVSLIEFIDGNPLKYIVIGKDNNVDDTFLYITLILENGTLYNYSFPANDKDFFFDQNTSIINNCLSFAINCSSSIKIISLSPKNQYALSNYQFDVERCLSGLLKRNYKNLEYYSTSIIGKNEQECLFIVYIGFVFYHDTKNRWFTAFIIINIPAERKPYKIIHQESVSYNIRPPGNKLKETINQWKMEFTLIANPGKNEKIQFLTNVNVDGVDIHGTRLIKAPEMNLIIADERNGKIIF